MENLVRWEREFQVWHYTLSYSQLLLRSLDVPGFDTRIDVLFSHVYVMHLQPTFRELRIDVASNDWRREVVDVPRGVKPSWYVINDGEAYVFATHCQWHEDQGDSHSPSKFGPLRGVE